MHPRARALLDDARDAIEAIAGFTADKSFEEYARDEILRAAVERKFLVIGEAVSQLNHADAAFAERIPHARRIVDFRNVLAHAYSIVDDRVVWEIVLDDPDDLRATVTDLLSESDDLPGQP